MPQPVPLMAYLLPEAKGMTVGGNILLGTRGERKPFPPAKVRASQNLVRPA